MKTIKDIVGKTNHERLLKAGIDTPQKILSLSEAQLMAISGIGPKTVDKLFKALGKKVNPKNTEKEYRKLKVKDYYKKVKASVKKTFQDPKPTINKLENVREEITLWNNALVGLRNIGREDKKRTLPYIPMSLTLDPFKEDFGMRDERDKFHGELFVNLADEKIVISYHRYDANNLDKVSDINDRLDFTNRTSAAQEVIAILKQRLRDFRKSTLTGNMVFVISGDLEYLIRPLKDEFSADLDEGKLFIVPGIKEFEGYEAMFKFLDDQTFEDMVEDLNRLAAYRQYEDEEITSTFEDYVKRRESWTFLSKFKEELSSILQLPGNNPVIKFGFLKAHPSYKDMKNYEIVTLDSPVYHAHTYPDYVSVKSVPPVRVGEKTIGGEIMSMVDEIFNGKYKIYHKSASSPIMIRSSEIPQIGMVIGG